MRLVVEGVLPGEIDLISVRELLLAAVASIETPGGSAGGQCTKGDPADGTLEEPSTRHTGTDAGGSVRFAHFAVATFCAICDSGSCNAWTVLDSEAASFARSCGVHSW